MRDRSRDRSPEQEYAPSKRRSKGDGSERRVQEARALRPAQECAILVGVGPDYGSDEHHPELDELAELARTAGARVVGRMVQRREHPEPSTFLGEGKLGELSALCTEMAATVVVCDTDLTPAQVRNIEAVLSAKVLDRSELILDIFALGARTHQARLQVELAQLRYQAPRLRRMWTHLSRITGSGGIGSRGPGEKQLEVDRRTIKRRITDLTRELAEIEGRRTRQVRSRRETFNVALVGYTNVGKSTLMKVLTGADVLIADQLFATLDTRTRRWPVLEGVEVLLSDTVGFIEKLPHHLVAAFHATLEEVRQADLLLHVADASDPALDRRVDVVRQVLREIGAGDVRELLVLNKCDRLSDPVDAAVLARAHGGAITVSARSGLGLDPLADAVREQLPHGRRLYRLRIPAGEGRLLSHLASVGEVESRTFDDDHCRLAVWLSPVAARGLDPYVEAEGPLTPP